VGKNQDQKKVKSNVNQKKGYVLFRHWSSPITPTGNPQGTPASKTSRLCPVGGLNQGHPFFSNYGLPERGGKENTPKKNKMKLECMYVKEREKVAVCKNGVVVWGGDTERGGGVCTTKTPGGQRAPVHQGGWPRGVKTN